MTIALDIDGVIIDFVSGFIQTVRDNLRYNLKYEDIYCHDISQVMGLPKGEVSELVTETLNRNNFSLMSGAGESIRHLSNSHDIILITGRSESHRKITENLLNNHEIPYKALYFSNYLEKHHINIAFDVFVEDSVEEAVTLSHQKGGLILLYNHPWNKRTLNVKNLFKRVNNWNDILQEISQLESQQK